jgi:hypothetical protein
MVFYTRIFCSFLQALFEVQAPGEYRWSSDEQATGIYIGDVAAISREVLDSRPAILVKRGDFHFGSSTMNQFQNVDQRDPFKKHFSRMVSAMVALRCISKVDTEASRIAWIAASGIERYKVDLQSRGRIHKVGDSFNITQPSDPGTLVTDSTNEVSLVSCFIPFYFVDAWTKEPRDKVLLKGIDVTLTSTVQAPAPGATVIPGSSDPVRYTQNLALKSGIRVDGTGPKAQS